MLNLFGHIKLRKLFKSKITNKVVLSKLYSEATLIIEANALSVGVGES